MKHLEKLSPRPTLVVDEHGRSLFADVDATRVGKPGPFGNERVVSALPLNKANGPVLLEPARVLSDSRACYVGDPDGNLIGDQEALWCHRWLAARWVADTRRLAV